MFFKIYVILSIILNLYKYIYMLRIRELKSEILSWNIHSERNEKQVWTNCEWFLVNFIKNWKRIRYFMKKSFVKAHEKEKIEWEYDILKKHLKNLIPNTVFIESTNKSVMSFSEPVIIDFDILKESNRNYIEELLKNPEYSTKIIKQLKFFIRKFELLKNEHWLIIDLYWEENLIYTKEWDIKYIDNYEVFNKSKSITETSLMKIEYLKEIIQKHQN